MAVFSFWAPLIRGIMLQFVYMMVNEWEPSLCVCAVDNIKRKCMENKSDKQQILMPICAPYIPRQWESTVMKKYDMM